VLKHCRKFQRMLQNMKQRLIHERNKSDKSEPPNKLERKSGIWVSSQISAIDDLGWTEKIALAIIDSFSRNNKKCFISNEWLAELLHVSERRASFIVNNLIKKNYIRFIAFNGRRRFIASCLDENIYMLTMKLTMLFHM
jgi:hypothetical protein